MREVSSNLFDGPLSPDGALDEARSVVERAVKITARTAGTKEAAVYTISRRYGLGAWLKRLSRGDKVTLHVHLYRRLCRALEEAIKEEERRLQHDKAVLAAIEATHAAPETDRPMAGAQGAPARRQALHLVGEVAR